MTRIRLHAGGRRVATGLWFVLALLAGGLFVPSPATADDEGWQEPPRRTARTAAQNYRDDEQPSRAVAPDDDTPRVTPRRHARAVAQNYPDDELPSRTVAPDDDSPRATRPAASETGDSSAKPRARKKKAEPAAEATPDDEPQPPRKTHSAVRRASAVEEEKSAAETNAPFANPDESDENDFGYAGPRFRDMLSNRVWFHGEGLLWWTRGGQTPPLLTTSPGSTPQAQAGVLGQPNTTILFGDQTLNTGLDAGTRMTFGLWLDRCEDSGLEFSYMILGQNTQTFSAASTGIPILARPFFNVTTGAQDSSLVAYPNAFGGTFTASSTENFQGAEALWRRAIVRGCDGRIDLLAGYRFQRLTDGLEIADSATSSGTATQAGVTANVMDTFHTRNDFNGGELGFATQWHRNRWSLETLLKLGIGQTRTDVFIKGYTTVIANGTNAQYLGGMLALPSNMGVTGGTHDSTQFSMMPEIGFTLGYDLTPRLKATAGYTLLYWSNVARPGDQIDLNIDPGQFPPATTTTATKPAFALHTSDFWAQGFNLGLDFQF